MAGVTPCYRGLGGNYRVYESRGFAGLAQQWEGAIRDQATWVEIVTWNDWGEAPYVAPFGSSIETGHWDKHWGPRLSHAAYLQASRYFIAWFKHGTPPKIAENALYYFYRLHPQALPGLKKPGGSEPAMARPGGADKLLDDVFVSAFLTAPARLTIHSGDTQKSFELVSGLSHVSMPFAPGRQRFVLTRGHTTIIEKTGEQEISATNAWGNFNTFAGEATR